MSYQINFFDDEMNAVIVSEFRYAESFDSVVLFVINITF